jgi:demethylmenaquinone methyltransferase/2-methoxy-6-polyprenyl-1,4-benzoquinol methylase
MFDEIAYRYDLLNHLLSLGQDIYWRKVMTRLLQVKANEMILDLAAGTGDSSYGLLRQGAKVVGLDLSHAMLSIARSKLQGFPFMAVQGSAYAMPFRDDYFDGVTCAFGIRNMPDTRKALQEMYRVVKPGGRIVILEFSLPTGWFRPIYRWYLRVVIPAVSHLLSKRSAYEYLGESIEKFYTPTAFRELMLEVGFVSIRQLPLSLGSVYAHYAEKPTTAAQNKT